MRMNQRGDERQRRCSYLSELVWRRRLGLRPFVAFRRRRIGGRRRPYRRIERCGGESVLVPCKVLRERRAYANSSLSLDAELLQADLRVNAFRRRDDTPQFSPTLLRYRSAETTLVGTREITRSATLFATAASEPSHFICCYWLCFVASGGEGGERVRTVTMAFCGT